MNVLHVVAGNLYGGVETFLVTTAQARDLAPAMAPEYAVCFPGRLASELEATGVPVHLLGPAQARRPWTVHRVRSAVRRLLAGGRYHAVACHMAWAVGLFGGVVRKAGVPLVAYFHGPRDGGWLERLAARQSPDLVVAPSRHSLDQWRAVFPRARAEVLNYPLPPAVTAAGPLPPDRRAAIRAELGAKPDDVVILQASRVEAWKGPDLVVRALGRLRDVPNWRFWFAGGPQRPAEHALYAEIGRIAAAEGIANRVALLGQRTDVPTLMRAADIYTQANRGPEGFSLSFLEASYCGLPVVTTDLGGAGEMVDAATGVLVPASEDVSLIGDALRHLIGRPEVRSSMSNASKTKALRVSETGRQLRTLGDYMTFETCP